MVLATAAWTDCDSLREPASHPASKRREGAHRLATLPSADYSVTGGHQRHDAWPILIQE